MISNATVAAVGSYQCVVSNAVAIVTSPSITVELPVTPPNFDTSPGAIELSASGLRLRLLNLSSRGLITVEASTNLLDWMLLTNHPPAAGSLEILDAEAANRPATFYRASEGP